MQNFFNKNIEVLSRIFNEESIEKIKNAEQPETLEIVSSDDGTPNVLIEKGSVKELMYDIRGWKIDADKRTKGTLFESERATLCIGVGLGFILKSILDSYEEDKRHPHHYICIEPDLWMLKKALTYCDFSNDIASNRLVFAITINDVLVCLELANEKYAIKDWNILVEKYTIRNRMYEKISSTAMSGLNQIRCNISTISNAGPKIADNDIETLPYIIHRRGVSELKNLWKNTPAIIVSTGPSLAKNLWRLIDKHEQQKAIIIAVGQALRPLLSYGIEPDFICSVDYGKINLSHYKGLMDCNVPLVALNKSYSTLLKNWNGPMFVSAGPQTVLDKGRIQEIINSKGHVIQGGSVAHMAMGVALHMGCDPIVFIGQDLAWEGNKSHFEQADSSGTLKQGDLGDIVWEIKDPRCDIQGDFSMGPPVFVPGYFMDIVKTNTGLASFIHSFERVIEQFPNTTFINCTEGGAHIKGTKRMSLKDFLANTEEIKIDKRTVIKPLLSNCDNAEELVKKAIPILENELNLLNQLINYCNKGIRENKKMFRMRRKKYFDASNKALSTPFLKAMKQNKKYSTKAYELTAQLPLVTLSMYNTSRIAKQKELNVDGKVSDLLNDRRKAMIRIRRNELLLKNCVEIAKKLKDKYKNALVKLTKAITTRDMTLLNPYYKEPEPDLSDAEKYFEAGNFARPMLEAKRILINNKGDEISALSIYNKALPASSIYNKALEMRNEQIEKAKKLPDRSNEIKYIDLLEQGHKIGREKKDFEKVVSMYEEALQLYPEGDIGLWGLATTYWHLGEYEKSKEQFEKLIEKRPDIPRYRFEYGQVLMYTNEIPKGIQIIKDVMKETDEFDSFFKIIGDILCKNKQYEIAIDSYKKYLKKFPGDHDVWKKLCETARIYGDEVTVKEATKKLNTLTKEVV